MFSQPRDRIACVLRAAARNKHGTLRSRNQVGESRHAPPRRPDRLRLIHGRNSSRNRRLNLNIQRKVQHHRPAFVDGRAVGARHIGGSGLGGMHPLRNRIHRFGQSILIQREVRTYGARRGFARENDHRGAGLSGLADASGRVREPTTLVHA